MQKFNDLKQSITSNKKPAKIDGQNDIRVLLVDDDDQYRKMLELVLKAHGLDVITSCNGREAMDQLHCVEVDLIVLDILMPEQEGIETIQQIKQLYPALKIIAISGGGPFLRATTSLHMAKNMGAHHILQKPFTNTELLNKIEDLVLS